MPEYEIKDSGARAEFAGGMVRDTEEGKDDWSNLRIGPMPRRIVRHLTAGREKYADPSPGIPNWTLGRGVEVWLRARASFNRHQDAWQAGLRDEDHAAGIYFNLNLAEYVRQFFTAEEEEQVQAIEELQRERIHEEAKVEDKKRKYLALPGHEECCGPSYRPGEVVQTSDPERTQAAMGGRALLDLKPDDGTGLDRNGDAK